jgi:hypothetical protein
LNLKSYKNKRQDHSDSTNDFRDQCPAFEFIRLLTLCC